ADRVLLPAPQPAAQQRRRRRRPRGVRRRRRGALAAHGALHAAAGRDGRVGAGVRTGAAARRRVLPAALRPADDAGGAARARRGRDAARARAELAADADRAEGALAPLRPAHRRLCAPGVHVTSARSITLSFLCIAILLLFIT
ncbi:hypothetical protein T492DRAFT_1152023, partial [Pavlovales sp. CCMP2436]